MKIKIGVLIFAAMIVAALVSGCTTNKEKTEPLEVTVSKESGDIEIMLPSCTLHYPASWEDRLSLEKTVNGETVIFFGTIDAHKRIELFRLTISNDHEDSMGTIVSNNETMYVSVKSNEFDFDSSWTDDEKSAAVAMQEDLNYVLDSLMTTNEFKYAE